MSFEEMNLEEFMKKYGSVANAKLGREAIGARFKKKAKLRSKTDWETALYEQICDLGLPKPLREVGFHPHRKWRFDFAWPKRLIAVEVEGGIYGQVVTCNYCGKQVLMTLKNGRKVKVRTGGRHQTGKGYTADAEKYSSAAIMGWCVIRVTPEHIKNGKAINLVEQAINRFPPRKAS
jgi:very-short-patch-repair endonuclease